MSDKEFFGFYFALLILLSSQGILINQALIINGSDFLDFVPDWAAELPLGDQLIIGEVYQGRAFTDVIFMGILSGTFLVCLFLLIWLWGYEIEQDPPPKELSLLEAQN